MFNRNKHLKEISNLIDECECLICSKKFLKQNALATHIKYKHNISSKEYFDKFFPKVNKVCICGNNKKFQSIKHGYSRYCGVNCSERGKGSDNAMFQNKRTEEWKKSHSDFMKGNTLAKGSHSNKGRKVILTEEHKNNIRKHLKRLNERGFENKGGRCKWYEYKGLKVQGRYELYFLMTSKLKLTKPKPIKTPFGFYTPDFESEKFFIEIKSTYTFKTCRNTKQFDKIKWVNDNIKRVKIKIIQEDIVENYLKKNYY